VLNKDKYHMRDESAMLAFAARVAKNVSKGLVLFLEGNLGAGKTTFARGFLKQLGYNGAVKSPTFTLVETYSINNLNTGDLTVYHFDLYRLTDPEELDYMGISDYTDGEAIILIEWPDKGHGFLPLADLLVNIDYIGQQREIVLSSQTDKGKQLLSSIRKNL
jgi:tRNA threonylcarbamoyladenosine biosynthesis protein TsaE